MTSKWEIYQNLQKLNRMQLHISIGNNTDSPTSNDQWIEDKSEPIRSLCKILSNTFLPAVFGKTLSHCHIKRIILSSIREGGLGNEELKEKHQETMKFQKR